MCACGNRSIGVSGHAIGIGTISTVADEVCTERSDSVSNQTNSLKMFGSFLSCVNVNFESAAYYVIFHLWMRNFGHFENIIQFSTGFQIPERTSCLYQVIHARFTRDHARLASFDVVVAPNFDECPIREPGRSERQLGNYFRCLRRRT